MHILSAAEMQVCDRVTTERFGMASIELMRAASSAISVFVREQFPHARRVTVLCGKGNNGGDGMMAARLLSVAGLEVTTLLIGSASMPEGDLAVAWNELTQPMHGTVHVVTATGNLEKHHSALDTDLIVDALLGTGFKPPVKGLAGAAIEWARASAAPVLAVDLPSGWPADATGAAVAGTVMPADAVITFSAPKPAHVFGILTRHWDQPVVVAPIGSPDAALASTLGLDWAGSSLTIAQTSRAAAANKGNFGHVLVVGGSFGWVGGKAGAPAMAAQAALRAGAGLVTAAVPAPALPVVAAIAPELMTWPLATTDAGQIAVKNLDAAQLTAITGGKTVLAIGPGLGMSEETAKFTAGLLAATGMPAVIDADALNVLAAKPVLLAKLAKGRTLVLTPHPGEMARLVRSSVSEVQENRLGVAREFAQGVGAIVVLKGARTVIAHPDGRVAVNTSGNPGMAKGGSGDVLTGLIAGLLAQYPENPGGAVEAAVYLHGLAADMAVREGDEHTLLATDALGFLARAFRSRQHRVDANGAKGYVWLQGRCGQ